MERKLAAIVFTDIAGFTKLSSEDERLAFSLIEKQREVLKPIVEEFNGEWLKEIGDGLLLTFPTVSGAVECSIKIQQEVNLIPELNLRIGIHEGEITVKGNDVFGDDVNIASRIEPFAAEGGIAISGKVQQNLLSLPEFETKFIGRPALKGVKQKVEVYCITSHSLPESDIKKVNAKLEAPKSSKTKKVILSITGMFFTLIGIFVWFIYPFITLSTAQDKFYDKKIAVLYFENRGNSEEVYYTDGLSEELMNRLTKIENLSVAPSFEVKRYKNMEIDLKQIYEDLSSDFVLYGNAVKAKNKIRISVELIDLNIMEKVWGNSYQKNNSQIFDIQDDIVENLISELGIEIDDKDHLQAISNPTDNLTAYDELLKQKNNFYLVVKDYEALTNFIKINDAIIKKDPEYADALVFQAGTLCGYYFYYSEKHSREEWLEILNRAVSLTEKAVGIDAENQLGLSLRPMILMMLNFVTPSTSKMMLNSRKALLALNQLSKKYPDNYLTKYALGNYYNIKSMAPIIADESDGENALNYLTEACQIMKKKIDVESNDFSLKPFYEAAMRNLTGKLTNSYMYSTVKPYILDEIEFYKKENNYSKLIQSLIDIGEIELWLGNYDNSIDYYLSAQQYANMHSLYDIDLSSNINIAHNFVMKDKIDLGIEILDETYNIIQENYKDSLLSKHDYYRLHYEYNLISGFANYYYKDFDSSIENFIKSIESINTWIDFKYPLNENKGANKYHSRKKILNNIMIANCYGLNGKKKNAKLYIDIAIKLIEENGISNSDKLKVNYYLSNVYKILKDNENYKSNIEAAITLYNLILNALTESKDINSFKNNVQLNKLIISEINKNNS